MCRGAHRGVLVERERAHTVRKGAGEARNGRQGALDHHSQGGGALPTAPWCLHGRLRHACWQWFSCRLAAICSLHRQATVQPRCHHHHRKKRTANTPDGVWRHIRCVPSRARQACRGIAHGGS